MLSSNEDVKQFLMSWENQLGDRVNKVLDFEEQFSRGGLLEHHHARMRDN